MISKVVNYVQQLRRELAAARPAGQDRRGASRALSQGSHCVWKLDSEA